MPIQSPFPPVPALPEINTHTFCFNRPDQAEWPEDYTLYIDARTGRKRKYKEFIERIRLGATGMNAPLSEGGLGIEPGKGELIGVLGQNSYNYISLIHSCLYLTIPFALISAYSTPFELNHAFNLAKPTRLFVDAKYLPAALPVAKKAGIPLSKIHVLDGAVKGRQSLSEVIKTVRVRKVPVIPVQPAKKDTLAYLVFSSGTSGLPKAVMISHGNIIYSMAQALINGLVTSQVHTPPPYNTPEGLPIVLAVLPLHHTYGLHYFTLRCFLAPSTYVLIGQWDLEVALKSIPKYQITAAPLIPSLIHQIVNYPQIHKIDFSSLTSAGSGAAYLPPDLAEKFKKLMPGEARLSEGYGMSEGTISAIIQPFPGILGGKQPITGSTGILMPGMEAKLVRDDGSEAGVDEVGELWLAGGNIALGYWGNEKATKETFVDGWLRTGDAFRVTEGGDFFFADRTKDTLKISGSQVSPVEIENCFLAHPKRLIIDATVAGVSGHGRTSDEKVPRAWVVLSDEGRKLGAATVVKELDEWHKENLSKYKWCRGGIEVVKQIPKSPTGKVLRRVLQDKYEQQLAKRNKAKL